MQRVIFSLGLLFLISCTKTDKGSSTNPPIVIAEESIKFSTNFDTGTYNVIDTLPLSISISSKLPAAGVTYSITATWTDSSKQIFKLDTSLNQSSLNLSIAGFKKYGNYNLGVSITSKSTPSNSVSKSLSIINDPLKRFQGYKVSSNAKQLGTSYWVNAPIPIDLMIYKFQTPPTGRSHIGNSGNVIAGDFNNDGWADIFSPGMVQAGTINVNSSFLIWNPTKKIFEDKNYFNDKSINLSNLNPPRTVPVYLNNDNYVDIVIFGYVDEGLPGDAPNPITLVLSDGKGGYDVNKINTETPLFYHYGGDVGDLNGDKIPDLVINAGGLMKILWGSNSLPYFSENNSATFTIPINNLHGGTQVFYSNNNGFGETCIECVSDYIPNSKIFDVNNDGLNDLILCGSDNSTSPSRILINKGNGRFNKSSIIYLPNNVTAGIATHNLDYILDDINSDGLNDIISLNVNWNYSIWSYLPYIQQKDGSFLIDKSHVINNFTKTSSGDISREKLIHIDVNGDGKKDIFYLEMNDMNQLKDKTVLIRTGNSFTEQPFYQFDAYAKSLIK